MPRILRIINRFNLGGPTYNAAHLTKQLSPEFETLLVGGSEEASEESSMHILQKLDIEPHIVSNMQRALHPVNDWKSYREIRKIIKEFKPDIVHTHASKAGAVGRLAAIHSGVPVIVHTFHGHVFHSYFGKIKTAFYKNLERYLASKSQSIVVISQKQKQEICEEHKICPGNKASIIHLGFDLDVFQKESDEKRASFRKQYRIESDEIAIGIIGRLVPIKNHRMFIDALHEVLQKTGKKIRAFIIGDGEEKEHMINYAGSKGISTTIGTGKPATITFTSWIKNVDWALAGLDIVALTSLNEGTPVSIIEAQAGSKAVVTTQVGGIEDIVINGQTALMCESGNHQKFAEHLLTLVENEEIRLLMGNAGSEFVRGKFSVEILATEMTTLYLELLEKHRMKLEKHST